MADVVRSERPAGRPEHPCPRTEASGREWNVGGDHHVVQDGVAGDPVVGRVERTLHDLHAHERRTRHRKPGVRDEHDRQAMSLSHLDGFGLDRTGVGIDIDVRSLVHPRRSRERTAQDARRLVACTRAPQHVPHDLILFTDPRRRTIPPTTARANRAGRGCANSSASERCEECEIRVRRLKLGTVPSRARSNQNVGRRHGHAGQPSLPRETIRHRPGFVVDNEFQQHLLEVLQDLLVATTCSTVPQLEPHERTPARFSRS